MSERYVTLAEVRDLLAAESEKRELLTSQKAALDHAQTVCPNISLESAQAIIEEVSQLEEVSDSIAVKIADLLPLYPEDVRAIFSKERITLEPDKIDQIIAIVEKYV
jgi:DNA-directed RNA polymerase subunit F